MAGTFPIAIPETTAQLRHLERRDWWRLAIAILVIGILTGTIGGLTLPSLVHNLFYDNELPLKVQSLWGAVLLFAVFAVYQQFTIVRLRRDTAVQIGMSATLEVLKRTLQDTDAGWKAQRKHPRHGCDQRIVVRGKGRNAPLTAHGHCTDISEGGMGVVLPEAFSPGSGVMLELKLDPTDSLAIPAIVRQRRGYYHGLEFQDVSPSVQQKLCRICEALPVVLGRSPADPAVPGDAKVHSYH